MTRLLRSPRRFLYLTVTLLGLLSTALAGTLAVGFPAGAATGSPVRFGVHLWGAGESDAALDLVAETGATLVPIFIPWRDVELLPGVRTWDSVDARVNAVTARGLMPYFIIGATPPWASDGLKGVIVPEKMSDWGNFVDAVINRYGDRSTYFSFFNEPDCAGLATTHGNCWNLHPDRYVEMLRVAREAIKAKRPEALVISGGLAGEHFSGNFDPSFLENILAAGAGRHVDAIDMHYYPAFRSNWEPFGTDVLGKVNAYRALLDRYGATNVRLVMSEISYPAGRDNQGIRHTLMSAEQFHYIPQGLSRAAAGRLEAIIWYTLADNGPNDYGITIAPGDGSVLPTDSFRSFQTATKLLKDTTPAGTLAAGNGVEGYAFTRATGAPIWALWSTETTPRTVAVPAHQIRVTDIRGNVTTRSGAGSIDLAVGPEAIFVELEQSAASSTPTPSPTQTGAPTVTPGNQHAVYLPALTRNQAAGW